MNSKNVYLSTLWAILLMGISNISYGQKNNTPTDEGFYQGVASELQPLALQQGKPYVIELNATWCGFCKLFERETLKDAKVRKYINQNFLMATMDGEEGLGLTLYNQYKLKGFPTLLFFAPNGKLLKKMVGYQDAEYFLFNLQKYRQKFEKKYQK